MKSILAAILAAGAAAFLLISPKTASQAASQSISACLEIIVPSLFAFSAVAIFLQKSGLYRVILKPFTLILSKILRTDEELCGVFLLANIGGYPVGITLLSALAAENRLSERDAARLMCCCFGSGPSFIIGIVGAGVFGSAAVGAAIFAACFLSSLLIAIFVRSRGEFVIKPAPKALAISSETFISSVMSAARAMFSVCVMVVGFSVIAAGLRQIGTNSLFEQLFSLMGCGENSGKIFPALLEITTIREISPTKNAVAICAGLLSCGGLCVFLQISALSRKIPLKSFLISRIFAAALSAGIAAIIMIFLPPLDIEVIASASESAVFSKNAILSLCTLAMSGILLCGSRLTDNPR
ncbi:MAG: hypothetical protein J6C38_09210 [Oscillospiraceae bacterium]|nr:hypothetical protein [Oscillospiraceae bacterium]